MINQNATFFKMEAIIITLKNPNGWSVLISWWQQNYVTADLKILKIFSK